jgi:hypothetical protein
MESSLRPLTLGEILDRTAQLYRTNFLLFAGIFALYAGIQLVLNLLLIGLKELLSLWHLTEKLQVVTWTLTGLTILFLFLLLGTSIAAINRAVAWLHLDQPATIRGAYRSVLPRLGRYLWLMTITAFLVWTPIVILYAGYFGFMKYHIKGFGTPAGVAAQQAAMSDPKNMAVIAIASLLFFVLFIPALVYTTLMALRYSLALPVCVVEGLKARPSLRRGVELVKGARGRIFVLGLLIGAIKLAVVGATQIFVFISVFKHPGQVSTVITILSQIVSFFTTTFLGPIYATGITLFYYDQRVRKEGFDIEWMMQAAGLTVPTPQPAEPPAAEPWLALDSHFDPPPPEPPSAEPPSPALHPEPPDPGDNE